MAPGVYPEVEGEPGVTERQERIPGFEQSRRTGLTVVQIGAGGIGGEISVSEVRKGVNQLIIFDHDTVDITNLNRQRFFRDDLYKNKAECLGRNLTKESTCRSMITAYPVTFQDAVEAGLTVEANVAVCGVDNNGTRVAAARFFLDTTPVIFIAVSEDGDSGYVFVQEPGQACFGCLFPHAVDDETHHPCSPAIIDILKVVAGVATYAVDTLIMDRKRNWNYKEVFLSGAVPERNAMIKRRDQCPICGSRRR